MLNIPDVIKNLFMLDGIRKNFRVHFPNGERADLVNKDIVEESVRFTESTCSQQTLRFGLTEASVIEFECVGVENIAGLTIECGIEIDVSSLPRADRVAYGTRTEDVAFPYYAVPYGVFVVDKCPRMADLSRRRVTAYTSVAEGQLDILGGQYYQDVIRVDTAVYRAAANWQPVEEYLDYSTDYVPYFYNSNGSGALQFDGAVSFACNRRTIFNNPDVRGIDEIAIVFCEFEADPYDDQGDELYKIAKRYMPSGDYSYNSWSNSGGSEVYSKCATNAVQAVASYISGFAPAFAVVWLVYDTGETKPCFPVRLQSGKKTIIVPKQMTRLYGAIGNPVGYYLDVRVIRKWGHYSSALWLKYTGSYAERFLIWDWPIREEKERRGEIHASVTYLNEVAGAEMVIASTLKTKATDLGTYKGYENAIATQDAADAVQEISGLFGNIDRLGFVRNKKLDRSDPYEIEKKSIEQLWYDEAETEKIGGVKYTYQEDGEDIEGVTFFRDAPGVYDLTRNQALEKLADRSQAGVEAAILEAFPQNAAQAHYTPIDLKMKALPWLEDGDAIRIETADGEIVDSFILRHTISGVQHLVDDIEAQGGA